MKTSIIFCLAAWLGLSVAHAEQACRIRPIVNRGNLIKFHQFNIDLLQADNPVHPRAWIGPMMIRAGSGPSCKVDASIISPPFFTAGDHYLYVTTYSGSENIQLAVNLKTCGIPWFSHEFVGPPRVINGNSFTYREAPSIKLGKNCLPISTSKQPG